MGSSAVFLEGHRTATVAHMFIFIWPEKGYPMLDKSHYKYGNESSEEVYHAERVLLGLSVDRKCVPTHQ